MILTINRDPTLPPYYAIKNNILIASALDDWEDADVYRLTAEQSYITSRRDAEEKQGKFLLCEVQM